MKKLIALLLVFVCYVIGADAVVSIEGDWVMPMQEAHKKFTGKKGTVILFGDSLTDNDSFWSTIAEGIENWPDKEIDIKKVVSYVDKDCWKIRGDKNGNKGGWTSRDVLNAVKTQIRKKNPEVAIVLCGTNDIFRKIPEKRETTEERQKADKQFILNYTSIENNLSEITSRLIANGTIPILSTVAPGKWEGAEVMLQNVNLIVRKIAVEKNVPLVEFYDAWMTIAGDSWKENFIDYSHPNFTGLNDFDPADLKYNGYGIRNYVTIKKYAEVYEKVLSK